eukprot:jgi/Tetstr1/459197/TSEL_004641.t1
MPMQPVDLNIPPATHVHRQRHAPSKAAAARRGQVAVSSDGRGGGGGGSVKAKPLEEIRWRRGCASQPETDSWLFQPVAARHIRRVIKGEEEEEEVECVPQTPEEELPHAVAAHDPPPSAQTSTVIKWGGERASVAAPMFDGDAGRRAAAVAPKPPPTRPGRCPAPFGRPATRKPPAGKTSPVRAESCEPRRAGGQGRPEL